MKYTREQIQQARDLADEEARKYGMSTNEERAWATTFANALGLEVEDPKPEPGLYLNTQGRVIVVSPEGVQGSIDPGNGRNGVLRELSTYSADELTPARVVPAEPVELTEEQVGELWDATEGTEIHWHLVSDPARRRFMVCLNAALAKYGHGVA